MESAEGTATDPVDGRIDGALEIESELSDLPGADADIGETEATGQVTEVQKLSSDAVPDTYPIAIDSEQAVSFRARITVDRETMVYLAWPDTYDESADLACLLSNLDISPDRFANIIGEKINLVVLDGQWVPEIAVESARPHPGAAVDEMPTMPDPAASEQPEVVMNDGTAAVIRNESGTRVVSVQNFDDELSKTEQPTRTTHPRQQRTAADEETNPDYYYGVLGIGGVWTAILFGLVTSFHIVPSSVTGLALLFSPVVFPFLIYRDAEHVAAHSDWSLHIAWTIGSFFWLINTFVFFGYAYKRRKALSGEE